MWVRAPCDHRLVTLKNTTRALFSSRLLSFNNSGEFCRIASTTDYNSNIGCRRVACGSDVQGGRFSSSSVGVRGVTTGIDPSQDISSTGHHQLLNDCDDPQAEEAEASELVDVIQEISKNHNDRNTATGAFQQLPMVSPSHEIIETALKRADRIGYNKKLKNDGARTKNRAARQLDTLMKELTKPLGKYEEGFIHPDRLHPFERSLLSLSVGEEKYMHAIDGVASLRKSVVGVAKGYAGRCSKSPTKKEALDLRDEGFANVESTYKRYSYVIEELKEIAKSLRKLPVVDTEIPTVALVGAPNVGKSSLVQLLSSGLPEVQNYPFTTRSIKMGHFYVNGQRCQVTDTPGLLCRADEDRNNMEHLTLASLQYLPTSVLFVMDLTEECGTSLMDQWKIREELLERFQDKPWVDVFSKCDILEQNNMLVNTKDEKKGNDAENKELDAATMAGMIPDACRVSSMTGDGIDDLKELMMHHLMSK
jgi:nucleolar GTP-binding protein